MKIYESLLKNVLDGNLCENLSCKLLTQDDKIIESKKLENVSWVTSCERADNLEIKLIADDAVWVIKNPEWDKAVCSASYAVIYNDKNDEPLCCYDFDRNISLMNGDSLTLRFTNGIYVDKNPYNPSKKIEKILLPEELFEI